MSNIINKKINGLDGILAGLAGEVKLIKSATKTVSIRIPLCDLARIDILAQMKDVSRNILLNEIIDAALTELVIKLENKNPDLAHQLKEKSEALAELMLKEPPEPPHLKGPKGEKKDPKNIRRNHSISSSSWT